MQEYKREHTRDKDLSRGSARHKGLLTSTLLRKPQRLRTTKVNASLTPITLGNRWRLSTRFTKGNTNTLELPQIGLGSFQEPLSVYEQGSKSNRSTKLARTSPSSQGQDNEGFAHKLTSKFHSQSMLGKDSEESRLGVNARWEKWVGTLYYSGEGQEMTVGGPRGINTPRSRTVTVIFQSSEPPRKISELPTSEISADCSPYGRNLRDKIRNLRTGKQQGQKQQQISFLWYGLGFRKDRLWALESTLTHH
jgi:hypothetical protein